MSIVILFIFVVSFFFYYPCIYSYCYCFAFASYCVLHFFSFFFFFFQAEDGIRDAQESRGLGDVYKRQGINAEYGDSFPTMGSCCGGASKEETDKASPQAAAENKCVVCGNFAEKRCSQCKRVWYCDKKCQEKDWTTSHATVCVASANPAEGDQVAGTAAVHGKEGGAANDENGEPPVLDDDASLSKVPENVQTDTESRGCCGL
eukprot:TRINITY_DN13327_c0_g1_i4.p2 TRINITY_DN13327_c0_g1~~TRINITY_DN13327_c0_g1_i4.p2  ORF type:complete len:204 (+),score=50.88 TRINITY_DN13327_c0_g1_i4:3-614(+)